jgi:hypothetical protein
MGYYTRILSPSKQIVSVDKLRNVVKKVSLRVSLAIENGTNENWSALVLSHKSGPEIAVIERNSTSSELGAEEIEEFLQAIEDCKPTSAVNWLTKYLPKVKTIYAFQWLGGTDIKKGEDILGPMMIAMHKLVGGVLQADGAGFSDDEQGDHILWQFSDHVKGPWRMAVLRDGKWVRFEMQLGNPNHRDAFLRGEVPHGAKLSN